MTAARCEKDTILNVDRSAKRCKLVICGHRERSKRAFLLAFPGSGADPVVIRNNFKVCRGRKQFISAVNTSKRVAGGTLDHFYLDRRYHFELVAPKDQPSWFDEDVRRCAM